MLALVEANRTEDRMSVEIKDYISVSLRAKELNCEIPSGLVVLPENFLVAADTSEFRIRSETATLKSLFRQNQIPFGELQKNGEKRLYIQNNAADLILPLIYVAASLTTGNEQVISIALGVVSNYVTDFFKGRSGSKTVELTVVVETTKNKSCKSITYKGDAAGLTSLPAIIKKISDD